MTLWVEVPTSLSVSEGNILSLTVLHRETTYTYPVVAGSGWEGGFETAIVQRPKDEQEIREERERIERKEREASERQTQEEMEGGGDEPPGEGVEVWDMSSYRPKAWNDYAGPPEVVDWKIERTDKSHLERMQDKVNQWHAKEIMEMQQRAAKAAREHPSLNSTGHSCSWIAEGAGVAGVALGTASGPLGWAVTVFGTSVGAGSVVGAC
jgi:hypothetical protein